MNGWDEYIEKVESGEIKACDYIRLAVMRFKRLKEKYEFREDKVNKVISFIGKLKHFTGKYYNQPFILSLWQQFIVASLYGFYREDGTRLVRNAYIEVARKQGKTALVAALSLYHLIADGEANAQCVLAATSAKQAKLCFDYATAFIKPIDPKSKYFKRFRDTIKLPATESQLQIVAADASKLDGLNCSFFCCDELHEHPDGKVYQVLKSSTQARTQPLCVCITTAGFNLSSFCYDMRSANIEILNGVKEDDSQFVAIYTLDADDDYEDESVWIKSSPNLGVTVTAERIREQALEAKNNPSMLTAYLTKLQNIWLSSSERWIAPDYIIKSQKEFDFKELGDYIYCGVDLGSTGDLTCLSCMMPVEGGEFYFKNYYFLPKAALTESPNREKYKNWKRSGDLIVTSGNVTDYDEIINVMMKINDETPIAQVAFDSWNATSWASKCVELGFDMRPFSQSISSLNRPTKEMARLILQGKVHIFPNPIDLFCFNNVVIKRDWSENERPSKDSYEQKIDGVMAMCNALGNYLVNTHYDGTVFNVSF